MLNTKKCIVLDLDNTLWGGVVGEDGLDGIALSLTPPGNSFMAFQQALLDHHDRGILLAINSRNNPNDAWEVIRTHSNMVLKEKHFAATRINWNDKVQNMKELAEELNIGLDSMVFLDDDKMNREFVRFALPMVETPELPADPKEYTTFLNSLGYFESHVITDEDKMRGNLYVTERLRKAEEKNFTHHEDFLKSLHLELFVYEDDNKNIARLSQLTEKTNQFNTCKKPLTESEVMGYIESQDHGVFYGKLQDRFGDHGVIIFAIVKKNTSNWHIESLLMSCRVFGRNVEDAFLTTILKRAQESRATGLTISFKETEKNMPAREFVDKRFKEGTFSIPQTFATNAWIKTIY